MIVLFLLLFALPLLGLYCSIRQYISFLCMFNFTISLLRIFVGFLPRVVTASHNSFVMKPFSWSGEGCFKKLVYIKSFSFDQYYIFPCRSISPDYCYFLPIAKLLSKQLENRYFICPLPTRRSLFLGSLSVW